MPSVGRQGTVNFCPCGGKIELCCVEYELYSMVTTYCLEVQVMEHGCPYYPPVGTVEYLTPDNAGYDLKVAASQTITPIATLVPLGVKARMVCKSTSGNVVEDCHFTLEPRSSIYKTGFIMANGRGIIDKGYRGELMAPLISVGSNSRTIDAGTRLFQIIAPGLGYIDEVRYVTMLPETVRGTGGFGSTGLK